VTREIERWPGSAPGRSRAVAFGDLVWAVADAPGHGGIAEQTRECLRRLDRHLAEAGSDRSRLLSVQIFLADIGQKAAMNDGWTEWLGSDPAHWPQRSCLGAELEDDALIEIVAIAARGRGESPTG